MLQALLPHLSRVLVQLRQQLRPSRLHRTDLRRALLRRWLANRFARFRRLRPGQLAYQCRQQRLARRRHLPGPRCRRSQPSLPCLSRILVQLRPPGLHRPDLRQTAPRRWLASQLIHRWLRQQLLQPGPRQIGSCRIHPCQLPTRHPVPTRRPGRRWYSCRLRWREPRAWLCPQPKRALPLPRWRCPGPCSRKRWRPFGGPLAQRRRSPHWVTGWRPYYF